MLSAPPMTPFQFEEGTENWEEEAPDFLSESEDRRPPSIHPSSLAAWDFEAEEEAINKWSFEAELERLKDRPDTAFYRGLRQDIADKRAECKREAEALGFPSWEAKERHARAENRKWVKDYVKEHGHLPLPPTMTEEQEAASKRREKKQREAARHLIEQPCRCLDHVAWWFCPQRLRSYKSQGHDPSDFLFLQALHPRDLNIHLEEDDPSRRVPERWLEHIWAMPSPSRVLHLPLWAKWDDVVQDMVNREEVDKVLYYGDPELQQKTPPPRRTVSSSASSWSDSGMDYTAEDLRLIERHGLHKECAVGLHAEQSLPTNTTNVDMAPASLPAEITKELSGTGGHSAGGPPNHGRIIDASDLGVHETTRASQAQSYKIKKRPGTKKEATRKATLSDKIQNHAQDILDLLSGDSGACANSLSHQ